MENKAAFIANLKQIIQYSKELHVLLQHDRIHFIKDDINQINESNRQKEELLTKINRLVSSLQESTDKKNGSLLERIAETAASQDNTSKNEISAIIKELENEITHCYQHMAVNSNVIYATMQHLKNFWDGLLAQKSELECVYDHTGRTDK